MTQKKDNLISSVDMLTPIDVLLIYLFVVAKHLLSVLRCRQMKRPCQRKRFVSIFCQVSIFSVVWNFFSHSHTRSIRNRTHTVPLMSPDTKLFQATGTQKIIITSMAGQSQMKFCKDIFPVSTGRVGFMTTI